MFKKELKVTSEHLLGKKDKKKMTEVLKAQNYQKESLNQLLSQQFTIAKLSGSAVPDKVRLISSEGNPILLEVSGTQNLFYVPTVYAIQLYPSLVPQVITNTGVRKFLLNGADLMWPGVHNPTDLSSAQVKAGDNVSIKILIQGGWEMTATGILLSPYSQEMPLKGRAVAIWNTIGDKLWNLGCRKILIPKYEITKKEDPNEQEEQKKEELDILQHSQKTSEGEKEGTAELLKEEEKIVEQDDQEEQEEKTMDSHSQDETNQSEISPEEMDQIIMTATLNCFKLSLRDNSELPLQPSAFKSLHLIPCSTMPIEFSSSSFKKLGRYLTHLHKMQLIFYDDPKGKNHPMITKIYHQNQLIKNHQPSIKKPKKRKLTVQVEVDSADDPAIVFSDYPRVVFREQFKMNKKFANIYSNLKDSEAMKLTFTFAQCKTILMKYVMQEGLEEGVTSKKDVNLDPLLAQFVHAKGDHTCSKADLFQKIKDNVTMYHIVEEIGNPAFNPSLVKPKMGPAPNVKVTMKSVANKKITLIQGLENYKVDESVTAKYLQKKCSGASSVGDNEIKLQGATHLKVIEEVLTQYLMIPQKNIEVQNLIKQKKKKAK